MIRILLGVLLVLSMISSSCSKEEAIDSQPALKEEQLTAIIKDLLIVEPALREISKNKRDSLVPEVYRRILDQNQSDMSTFQESMQWYQERPQEMIRLYEIALEKIKKQEAEMSGTKVKKVPEQTSN